VSRRAEPEPLSEATKWISRARSPAADQPHWLASEDGRGRERLVETAGVIQFEAFESQKAGARTTHSQTYPTRIEEAFMTRQFVRVVLLQSALLLAALGLTSAASAQDASGFCMYAFNDWDMEGDDYYVRQGTTVNRLDPTYNNDAISSFEVIRGCTCRIYEHFDLGGDVVTLDARYFRITVSKIDSEWNDTISSNQCDGRRR
jgi:hypothetical protein